MVTELLTTKIKSEDRTKCDYEILSGFRAVSVSKKCDKNASENAGQDLNNNRNDVEKIARDILDEVLDKVMSETSHQMYNHHDRNINNKHENVHRKTYQPDDSREFSTGSSIARSRTISECIIGKHDNLTEASNPYILSDHPLVKPKKRISFKSLLKIRDKTKNKDGKTEDQESYDELDPLESVPTFRKNSLRDSKRYHSAFDVTQKPSSLHRTPSLFKKLVSFGEDSKSFLKRSLSFRDVTSKKGEVKRREELIKAKEQEWRQSLKSLAESDLSVSYQDLSFVDYDYDNGIKYNEFEHVIDTDYGKQVTRSNSCIIKGSPKVPKPALERGTSCHEHTESRLIDSPAGLSLPSLHHIEQDDDEETSDPVPLQKYRRRPQSICSEDGGSSRSHGNGSFSSSGSGCAKLKRTNACRQKTRDVASFINDTRQARNDTVRSRSLNHLDTLEMRQGIVPVADSALKDSRSEPDCTKPLLVPPTVNPEPKTPTADTSPLRKHMLSRSQKSSSECFSVNFEVGDESTWENELFFPAQRGILLHESLAKMCELRNIDLSACDARLQDKENNFETFLPYTQDTAGLVGRHIRITAKEPSNKRLSGSIYGNHIRKQSGSYKPRTGSFFSSSADDPNPVASSMLSLHEGDQSRKQIKQMITSFFANSKDSKYDGLIDQLDKYTKHGIPKGQHHHQVPCESVDALYKLEDDWRDIVEYKDLTEKQQQQQTVLWELIKTEVAYIKTLKVVTNLFLSCLQDLQTKNLLKEIDTEKLFSNITEILEANVVFWRSTLFPLVKDMRKYRRPACIENMLSGFSSIQDTFQPYFKYCAEQSRCQHYCRENSDSDVFAAYLTWCESQKDCNRLRLVDILVQPMQRLTKYGLLLKAVLKNTEEDVERENLQTMIKMVDEFVNSVNSSLKHKQDKERLKGIIARIESYDIVESKDDDIEKLLKKDRSLTQLDLNRPMLNCPPERKRHLLLEGDLKLKDSQASKMEVHCFLLTDMLLICKPSTKKGGATMRVIRQPYLVDRIVVCELNKETPSLAILYKNEFDMVVAAFVIQNIDAKKLKGWKDGIAKAQALYAQAKQMSYIADESLDTDYGLDNLESDYHSLQLAPRSPIATSSRASRVSSLAHSHSGSVEMNDQSSVGSAKEPSKAVSVEAENRTGSLSSDEGVQSLPPDNKSPVSQKNSFKNRLFHKTPNTLSVQPFSSNLGQSLPNLTLGSPNVGSLSLSLNQNTLSVPNSKNGSHLLSPTNRGISYPPPSPTRANLRRGLAISQSKNPPLIKTRHVNSTASVSQQVPASVDFDVPVIAGISQSEDHCESFSRGQHRQAMKRTYRNDKRYYTAGVVDDIKKNDSRDASIHKRLSWNSTSLEQRPINEDHT